MHYSESWRRRYIRLLTEPKVPDSPNAEENIKDAQAIADLVGKKYLRGQVPYDANAGRFTVLSIEGVTVDGHLFAEDQQAILDSKTFTGRLKAGSKLFGAVILGWFLGLLAPLVQQGIEYWLHPNIQQHNQTDDSANKTEHASSNGAQSLPKASISQTAIPAK
jgi:hypothetical protein